MITEEFSSGDLFLINTYQLLNARAREDLTDYLQFLLAGQYKQDLKRSIFNNALLDKLITSMKQVVQREEFEIEQVERRARQVTEVFFSIYAEVYCRYAELIPDLDCCDQTKTLGHMAKDNIIAACCSGNRSLIQMEVIDFCDTFHHLSKKKIARQLIAV